MRRIAIFVVFTCLIFSFGLVNAQDYRIELDEGASSGLFNQAGNDFDMGIGMNITLALRYVKEAVNKGSDMTLEQGLRLEADLYYLLHTTIDRIEGIRAFLKKRPTEFKGQ